MKFSKTYSNKVQFAGSTIVVALVSMLTSISSEVNAASIPVAISTPTIKVALEPYTPDGKMRLYTVSGGTSYWTQDMPIYQGDSAKIDIFVSTGANELQQLKVRLDNTLLATINSAPWSSVISANQLTPGYHFIETWAQVSGSKPQSPQFATNNFTFFVSPSDSIVTNLSNSAQAPVVQVKGQAQELNNGQVTNVPLDNSPVLPAVPSVLAGADTDSKATVRVEINDEATNTLLSSVNGVPIAISDPAVVSVIVPAGSTAQNFAYTIERGDQTIETSGKIFAADATHLRIQPRTQTKPGMLDGVATLYVWGVDSKGNFGKASAVTFNIINAFGG